MTVKKMKIEERLMQLHSLSKRVRAGDQKAISDLIQVYQNWKFIFDKEHRDRFQELKYYLAQSLIIANRLSYTTTDQKKYIIKLLSDENLKLGNYDYYDISGERWNAIQKIISNAKSGENRALMDLCRVFNELLPKPHTNYLEKPTPKAIFYEKQSEKCKQVLVEIFESEILDTKTKEEMLQLLSLRGKVNLLGVLGNRGDGKAIESLIRIAKLTLPETSATYFQNGDAEVLVDRMAKIVLNPATSLENIKKIWRIKDYLSYTIMTDVYRTEDEYTDNYDGPTIKIGTTTVFEYTSYDETDFLTYLRGFKDEFAEFYKKIENA
jgi:hypothetical protein